jgi:hypothetical protein
MLLIVCAIEQQLLLLLLKHYACTHAIGHAYMLKNCTVRCIYIGFHERSITSSSKNSALKNDSQSPLNTPPSPNL